MHLCEISIYTWSPAQDSLGYDDQDVRQGCFLFGDSRWESLSLLFPASWVCPHSLTYDPAIFQTSNGPSSLSYITLILTLLLLSSMFKEGRNCVHLVTVSLSSSGGQRSKMVFMGSISRCQQGFVSSGGPRGESDSLHFPASRGCMSFRVTPCWNQCSVIY